MKTQQLSIFETGQDLPLFQFSQPQAYGEIGQVHGSNGKPIRCTPVDGMADESPDLAVPDMETLMEWMDDGAGEAACPHGCIVETDGYCEHGKPSWLIVLGLI